MSFHYFVNKNVNKNHEKNNCMLHIPKNTLQIKYVKTI